MLINALSKLNLRDDEMWRRLSAHVQTRMSLEPFHVRDLSVIAAAFAKVSTNLEAQLFGKIAFQVATLWQWQFLCWDTTVRCGSFFCGNMSLCMRARANCSDVAVGSFLGTLVVFFSSPQLIVFGDAQPVLSVR